MGVVQDATIELAKTKGKYENGIVSLQGMTSIASISRELLHVDPASGTPYVSDIFATCETKCMWFHELLVFPQEQHFDWLNLHELCWPPVGPQDNKHRNKNTI